MFLTLPAHEGAKGEILRILTDRFLWKNGH